MYLVYKIIHWFPTFWSSENGIQGIDLEYRKRQLNVLF